MILNENEIKGTLESLKKKDASFKDMFRTSPFQNVLKKVNTYFDSYENELNDFINRRMADLNQLNVEIAKYIQQKVNKTDTASAKVQFLETLQADITKEKNGLKELFSTVKYK